MGDDCDVSGFEGEMAEAFEERFEAGVAVGEGFYVVFCHLLWGVVVFAVE